MQTVAQIIDALGGSAVVARETAIPLTTIESWKSADFVPDWRRDTLLSLALRKGVAVGTTDFPARKPRQASAAA